ncbi:glycosyltransferase family 4 protein [Geosporobacter ferrireducens]|uniref:glycosyltransferase family 4 protein n=1 Tax=Geosporobacter ferrireducens TaxID=1424294 RepID=UPI00139EC047|nr:glycosyltransferase family 1 protein [Geosporobacter ferrireducens]MTI53328.1 glycosyltransferase family 4 protein [Geosporobacter ferrireducens]
MEILKNKGNDRLYKVAIDIRPTKTKGNGISKYTEEIMTRLKDGYLFLDGYYNIHNSIREKIFNKIWEQIILPFKIIGNKIEVFHCTKNMGLPIIKMCKYVVTIHDLIPMIFEQEYLNTPLKKFAYNRRIRQSINLADIIITDSKYSKQDIITKFAIDESKIRVVYLGVDDKIFPVTDLDLIEQKKSKYKIEGDYILGIGSNEPRKNVKALLEAYKRLKKNYQIEEKLVIMGKNWMEGTLDTSKDVIFTGYVDEKDLCAIYSGAKVFVYPSLYEGFGLPPLEAMACGTPVVTSNSTSIPEVVGDAAVLADPKDIQILEKSIIGLLQDSEYRNELRNKGFERVKRFKWEITVDELKKVYKEVIES